LRVIQDIENENDIVWSITKQTAYSYMFIFSYEPVVSDTSKEVEQSESGFFSEA